MKRTVIRLLGSFEVSRDGEPLTGFKYAKVRALLAYLAAEPHHAHPRAQLAALFWPTQSEGVARASLSQALTTLRNALGDKSTAQPLVLGDALSVWLAPHGAIELDVSQFVALLHASTAHEHHSWRTCAQCAERLLQALQLYRGHFLADLVVGDSSRFAQWVAGQREQLLQHALSALERLVEQAEWRAAYAEAITYAQRQVTLEPHSEVYRRALIRLLALNGEPAAALAQAKQLQAMLNDELAAEPEAATVALVAQIRAGALASLQPQPTPFVVPAPPTPLVGRSTELGALCARLQERNTRAITLIGTGGIGKTRLAIEAAHALRYAFEDGVYVVELAALSDAALVADAIAQTLGVQERSGRPIGETLADHLRAKHLLLVLDNFEHVVEAAPAVSALLAACPKLTTLTTSRTPLDIRAEQQFALEPLADAEAVQLFVQRAQAVGATWAANGADTTTYTAICRQLDRLPLAIELIAVRARTLSASELLRQLDRPLEALTRGPRDLPTRHQTLRSAIQWSYDLLDPPAQRAFASLGVFAGGWSAEAAQAVLGSSYAALTVLELLHAASLVQKQLVGGETRFSMLNTIREFALEQLALPDAAESAYQRHAAYFARFAMAAYVELLRAEAAQWRTRIAAEQDNLRAAFHWALEHQLYETALRIATGVWRFHWMSGFLREALERLELALAHRAHAPLAVQEQALRAAGTLAVGLNNYARARRWLETAVTLARRLDDPHILQPALTNLGFALLEQGELEAARTHLEQALALARRGADQKLVKFPLGMLAGLHQHLGDYAAAQAMSEECLHINQTCGDPEGTANALRILASILLAQGDLHRAHGLAQEALALHRSLDHRLGMGLDYVLFGDMACEQNDHTTALEQYQRCLDLWRDREHVGNSGVVLNNIAHVLSRLGDYARAASLLGAATAMRERASIKLLPAAQTIHAQSVLACRTALGEAAYSAAWANGSTFSPLQALNLACEPASAVLAAKSTTRVLRAAGPPTPRGPRPTTRGNPLGLTRREAEVLALLAEGLTNAAIGARLGITPKTADHHVAAILAKLGAHTRGEAVAIAHRCNVLA